ncbi:MAG: PorV/PorQ family protein [Bacteroidota bacterium]
MRYITLLFLVLLSFYAKTQEEDFANFFGGLIPADRLIICPTFNQPVGLPFLGMGNNCFVRSFDRIMVVAPEQDAIISSVQNPALLHQPTPYNAVKVDYSPWQSDFIPGGVYAFKASVQKQFRKGSSWDLRYENFAVGSSLNFSENSISRFSPQLQTVRLAYANSLSDHWSMGLAVKYASQKPRGNNSFTSVKTINVAAADIGFKCQNSKTLSVTQELRWQWGFSLSNLAPKVESQPEDNFRYPLPTTFSAGFLIEQYTQLQGNSSFRVRAAYQINKLLTPSSCTNCDEDIDAIPDYLEHSALGGILVSFSDSADGLSGELKEINHQLEMGGTYQFSRKFSLRSQLTLFYQQPRPQESLQYLASQLGIQWGKLQFDFVYYTSFSRPDSSQLGASVGYLHFLEE